MKPFPKTSAFLLAASRIVWFKSPEDVLQRPVELLAYAMKHSTDEDMALLISHCGWDGIREALDHAPPGIIDPRSWAYWNLKVGHPDVPPMPVRDIGNSDRL